MKLDIQVGSTSIRTFIFVQDSSQTTGVGLTGLVFNSGGLIWYDARDDDGNAGGSSVTLATATLGTWTSGGFKEKDAAHMPGVYEIGIPNAALATGSKSVVMMLSGATNMVPVLIEIELVAYNPFNNTLGIFDLANGIETGYTFKQATRLMLAAMAGKASGLDTGLPIYRSADDSANRISATTDGYGNRTSVTLTP